MPNLLLNKTSLSQDIWRGGGAPGVASQISPGYHADTPLVSELSMTQYPQYSLVLNIVQLQLNVSTSLMIPEHFNFHNNFAHTVVNSQQHMYCKLVWKTFSFSPTVGLWGLGGRLQGSPERPWKSRARRTNESQRTVAQTRGYSLRTILHGILWLTCGFF